MKELTTDEIILSGLSGNIENGLDSRRKQSAFAKSGANEHRLQMIERIAMLPTEMQKLLKEDRAQISDKTLWVIRDLEGTSTELIMKNEKASAGKGIIDDAELGENQWFFLYAISLTYRSKGEGKFDEIFPDFLANANYIFKLGTRELIGKNPVDDFQSPVFGYTTNLPFGTIQLVNPKMIVPKKTISFKIEDAPATMSGQLKLKLRGIEVKPY